MTGFGPATGKVFVAKGWNVVATMRDVSVANDLAERENVLVSRLDVTDPVSIGHAIEASIKLSASSTRLSIAPATASTGYLIAIPQQNIQNDFDVNLFGVMNVIRAIMPVFRKQKEGLILNVSSVGGLIGLPSISTKWDHPTRGPEMSPC